MKLTDTEVARLVVDYPSDRISYQEFDRWIDLDDSNESNRNSLRYLAMQRINTLLEKGMAVNDAVHAYRLEVGKKLDHYERKPLAESASLSIRVAAEKASQAIDRAARQAAYALGDKRYYRLTDRRYAEIRKPSPGLPASELAELRVEYRMLMQTQSLLLAVLGNAESSVENIERLISATKQQARLITDQSSKAA